MHSANEHQQRRQDGDYASHNALLWCIRNACMFAKVKPLVQALFAIEGHQLDRMKLRGCFLSAFPGDQEALQAHLDRAKAEAQPRQHPQGSAGENAGTPTVQISAAGQDSPLPSASEGPKASEAAIPVLQQQWPEPWEQKLAAKRAAEHAAAEADTQSAQRATEALVLELQSELQQEAPDLKAAAKGFQYNVAAPEFSLPEKAAPSQASLASTEGLVDSSAGRDASLRPDAPAFLRRNSSSSQTGLPSLLKRPPPAPIPGKSY